MPCFKPITAYLRKGLNKKTGKKRITFKPTFDTKQTIKVPCGQCRYCRLERSRIWSIRCMHESQLHDFNQYVTITYSDENLPSCGSLVKSDLQKFFKRLRKKYGKVRHYSCGEYGDEKNRPHYHSIIFGLKLDDRKYHSMSPSGFPIYRTEYLTKIWGKGYVTTGDVTFESCAYVARYIMKKQLGKDAEEHYLDRETGVLLEPEYTVMSNRPGIGKDWYNKYKSDVYQEGTDGKVIIRGGLESKPPRYYDELYESESLDNKKHLEQIKERRAADALSRQDDNTKERLRVKEIVSEARTTSLKRSLKDH